MKKASIIIPCAALILSVAGLLIRQTEIKTIFNITTGFAEHGAPITIILIGLTIIVLFAALAFSLMTGLHYSAANFYKLPENPVSKPFNFILFILGFLWVAVSALYYYESGAGSVQMAELILCALSALSGVSVIVLATGRRKNRSKLLCSVIPSIFFCFWIILLYKENAANPVLLSYSYECLAIAFGAISYYYFAGFIYDKGSAGKTVFSLIMTIYFGGVFFAGQQNLYLRVIVAVVVLIQAVNMCILLRNLEPKHS